MDIDAQLLDRYVRTRDAEAFTQLVRRHGGMVFAVARRITLNHHDAEEITQGCFLDLARKAGSIQGSLAGWLHTAAAYRAIDANRAAGRRHRHEKIAAQPEVQFDEGWGEIAPVVDTALAELPEELRLPVVIYYLEGRGQAEVAEELGVTQATVSRRLEAGVAALREKLKAAGVVAPSVALPVLLAQHAIVSMPQTLVAALGKLAISGVGAAAAGTAGVSGVSGASGAASGAASSGAATSSGAASVAAKGTAMLAVKVMAAIVITAAVSTVGVTLFPKQSQSIAVAAPEMGGELGEVVTRLKREIAQGVGDGLGVVTESYNETDNQKIAHFPSGILTLYAQQGESHLFMRYSINMKMDMQTGTDVPAPAALDKIPSWWPNPTADDALRFADETQTPFVFVTDGQRTWGAWLTTSPDGAKGIAHLQSHPATITQRSGYYQIGPAQAFWPAVSALESHVIGSMSSSVNGKPYTTEMWQRVALVHRSDNPGLVGIQITSEGSYGRDVGPQNVMTYWLDPARNDVPVELDTQYFKHIKHGQFSEAKKTQTQYLDFAQLRDGRWYPIHWQTTESQTSATGGVQSCDCRFTFYPDKLLDARWFGDPTTHFIREFAISGGARRRDNQNGKNGQSAAALPHAIAVTATKVARSAWWWWPWALALAVFGAAGVLLIRQRLHQAPTSRLHGYQGPRRR